MKNLMLLVVLSLGFGCGSGETKYVRVPSDQPPQPPQRPQPPQPPNGNKTSFSEARQIIGQYCESCHANSPWLRDAQSLKASSVKARTQNNSMPPGNSPVKMGNAARDKLIKFF